MVWVSVHVYFSRLFVCLFVCSLVLGGFEPRKWGMLMLVGQHWHLASNGATEFMNFWQLQRFKWLVCCRVPCYLLSDRDFW